MDTLEPVEVAPAGDARPALTHRQVLVIFSGLMLGMALAAIDQTVVATALPTIVGDLGGLNHLSWVVTAYLLSETVSSTAASGSSRRRSSSSWWAACCPDSPSRC